MHLQLPAVFLQNFIFKIRRTRIFSKFLFFLNGSRPILKIKSGKFFLDSFLHFHEYNNNLLANFAYFLACGVSFHKKCKKKNKKKTNGRFKGLIIYRVYL